MNRKVVLKGNLNFLGLADILQLLSTKTSTGILRISSEYAKGPGIIYLASGNTINASCGSLTGLDAIYSLFSWSEGKFEFILEDIKDEDLIQKNTMHLILEGLRMLDEGIIKRLGPEHLQDTSLDSSDKKNVVPLVKSPLVDYGYVVDREKRSDGETFVKEGTYGTWIFVILKGIADVLKETSRGPLRIMRVGEGAFVGSIAALLKHDNVRGLTARAVGDVQLGVLDSQALYAEYGHMSPEFRSLIISLDKRLKQVTDRVVDSYLETNHSKELIKDKKSIIDQGKAEQRIFMINRGKASVVRSTDNGLVTLADLGPGDFFGCLPFAHIDHESYSASVFASDDLDVSMPDPEVLREEYMGLSPTFRHIIEHVATCISLTTQTLCK